MQRHLFVILAFIVSTLHGHEDASFEQFRQKVYEADLQFAREAASKGLSHEAKTDSDIDSRVQPYLLPLSHWSHDVLDHIFSVKGVLKSIHRMKNAGFEILCYRQGRGLIVARHPSLKGFLVKAYLDIDHHPEWTKWVRRTRGSALLKNIIKENKTFKRYFRVPKKWIYRIPEKFRGRSQGENSPKEYILLVEDMNLVDKETNSLLYRNALSYKAMDSLFVVLEKSGFSDSHPGNIPFTKEGKIAFIDTEFTGHWPVHPEWISKMFTGRKLDYWNALINNKGPKTIPKAAAWGLERNF